MNMHFKSKDIIHMREKMSLTQQQFADKFGFSLRTVQNWEQGTRQPRGYTHVLLLWL